MSSYRYGLRAVLSGMPYHALVSRWGHRGTIKTIQRGTVAIPGTADTATITSVRTGDTRLVYLGDYDDQSTNNPAIMSCRLALTNATTITGNRSDGAGTANASFEVIEYWPGVIKLVQRGTITILAAGTSGTATITAVNTANSTVDYLGSSSAETGAASGLRVAITLTDTTTVTATRGVAPGGADVTVGYQVTEWYRS